MKFTNRIRLFAFLLTSVYALNGFAQHFDGTNLSSSKPFYGDLPYVFEGSENYFITFQSNPDVVRALVPEPLQPISNGEITVIFAKHHISSPAKVDYNEAYFIIPVSYGTTYGGYIPVLYLDKIETITPAREIWGYNKVGGSFQFIESDNNLSITVTQMDTLLMEASFVLGESFTPPEQSPAGPVLNLKYIPSVTGESPPDVKQITVSELQDRNTILLRLGTARLNLYSSRYNPLNEIPVLEIKSAGYSKVDFTMVYGRVLHDYLKSE